MQTNENSSENKIKNLQQLFNSGEIHTFQEEDFINQAFDFMDQNLLVDCKLLFEEGLKKFPNSAKIFFEFGYFMFENGEIEPAKQYLMKVTKRRKIINSQLLLTRKTLKLCSR